MCDNLIRYDNKLSGKLGDSAINYAELLMHPQYKNRDLAFDLTISNQKTRAETKRGGGGTHDPKTGKRGTKHYG